MLTRLRHLLEMIRFSHTLFALPFALLAALMAWHERAMDRLREGSYAEIIALRESFFALAIYVLREIRWQELLGILICMIGARSAAMAFNRLIDHRIDAANPRTATRHIPAGVLSWTSVLWFTLLSSVIFVAGTLLFLPENPLPIVLALPVLAFLCGYSYAKRFTSLAHYWLGLALGLAPICAWIALRGNEILKNPADLTPALLLGAAVWTWVAGFDIIYACQDAEFDRNAGLFSVPARLGVRNALRVAAASHFVCVLLLAALPWSLFSGLGTIYLAAVGIVAPLLIYEHAIVRPDDLTRVNIAFFNVNILISMGLLIAGTIDLLT